MSKDKILIRPGHANEIKLESVQVTSDPNIESISPITRGCLFNHEQPENYTLRAHKKYTQATCKFECHIQEALLAMKDEDKCLPWYYPQVDPDARLCSPFEARKMRTLM